MKTKLLLIVCCLASVSASVRSARGASKLVVLDSPFDHSLSPDTAIDPSVNPNGEMYLSRDIWVTQDPMPGYVPYPFMTRPIWLPDDPNQNPQYRDPLFSRPNYIYVRITNAGDAASSGTERLHLYWSKAATTMNWPDNWIDYRGSLCGVAEQLYGMEITKPRRNIADTSISSSEVARYLMAITQLATDTAYRFSDGVQYWYKQNPTHAFVAQQFPGVTDVFAAHRSEGFWPWHREFVNRYEMLLRKVDPTVTLFYWDWTQDPRTWDPTRESLITAIIGGFSGLLPSEFSNSGQINAANAPFPRLFGPPSVSRFTGTDPRASGPDSSPDSDVIEKPDFKSAAIWCEGRATVVGSRGTEVQDPRNQDHNHSHTYIGGLSGNMSTLLVAAQDPFFFLLHANVDRLWSEWQRAGGDPSRYDPSVPEPSPGVSPGNPLAYSGTMNLMTQPMAPWNGFTLNGTSGRASPLPPWQGMPGDQTVNKTAADHSVVFPPVYDRGGLTIPMLQPHESVVLEIPWYPPNPADFRCDFPDPGHVCLLARVTTSDDMDDHPPMPPPGSSTSTEDFVRNNWGVAWRNEVVLDGGTSPPGPLITEPVFVRNASPNPQLIQLGLSLLVGTNRPLTDFGLVSLDLGQTLYSRWLAGGAVAHGFVTNGGTQFRLVGTNGLLSNLFMSSNEVEQVQVALNLYDNYGDPGGKRFPVDLTQYGGGGNTNQMQGGQRFTFDFNQLDIVERRSTWRYWATGQYPGPNWNQVGFDDSQWPSGQGKLGFGVGDEATVFRSGTSNSPAITTWFRYDFAVNDPTFFRNLWLQLKAYDGAVVYLNGIKIAERNMPNSPVSPDTLAATRITGLDFETFYPFDVSSFVSLLAGTNVLAVEVHAGDTNVTDLGLDVELSGNVFKPSFPPTVAFLPLANGGLNNFYLFGKPIQLMATASGPGAAVTSVSYYSDSQFVGTATTPPYTVTWSNAPLGIHQMTCQATDAGGNTGSGFATLRVLTNIPPVVYVTSPTNGQRFSRNSVIPMTATAQELGGAIQRVDFYYTQHGPLIDNPIIFAGTSTVPPYSAQLTNLPPACYMLTAVATDTYGVQTYSVPVEIAVSANPIMSINFAPPFVIVSWSPTNAILQQAASLEGPWQSLTNATSPYGLVPKPAATNMFFRATLPPGADAFCNPP